MSKPILEKYEQILAQDPTSTVFVELAKALIEKGDHVRAIDVCKTGLSHHKESVVGRVLWGKALINLGRPAEAMEQFDFATTIDRENPHAYNLIGEVLLHKGLYRSALPLLKKAVALQPNDGRVRQWLEQTQRVLAGGPAPVLVDPTTVDPVVDPSTYSTDPGLAKRVPLDADAGDATDVNLPVYVPGAGGPPIQTASDAPTQLRPVTVESPPTPSPDRASTPAPDGPPTDPAGVRVGPPTAAQGETVRGLTKTFDALTGPDAGAALPVPPPDAAARAGATPNVKPPPPIDDEPRPTQPTVIPSQEQLSESVIVSAPGLLDDVPSARGGHASVEVARPSMRRPPPPRAESSSLLGDIPDAIESSAPIEVPKVEVAPHVAEAIAKEYERELREKLAAAAADRTFLQRNGWKLGGLAVVLVVAAAGGGGFYYSRVKHKGMDLPTAVAEARKAIALDTRASYRAALELLKLATETDDGSTDAWALTAYADGLVYAEHGGAADDKVAALSALAHPGARDEQPALALVTDFHLADARAKDEAKKELLASTLDTAEVNAAAGRVLLADKKTDEGIKRLSRAIELRSGNVRALVALGDYYREFGDYENAARLYSLAVQASREHPQAVLGLAQARLELGREQADALKDVEALPEGDALEAEARARRELARGRLLASVGRGDEAIKVLTAGQKLHPALGFEYAMALGEATRAAGQMDDAQKAFEAALKARPKSDDAKEGLGRVLLARDRERELLTKVEASGDARKVYLVRGIAWAKVGEWKKARGELARTQVNGKFPTEAVVYLALADAADGQADKAQEVLEKTLGAAKRGRTEVRLALGQLYWKRNALDKAKAQFEEAAKDAQDYEGACALGRLLLQLGLTDLAIDPLTKAVAKNGSHGEARHALGRAYLAQGNTGEALAQAEAWVADNPGSGEASRDLAFALLRSGRAREAEVPSFRAVKADPSEPGAQRVRAMVLFARGESKTGFASLEKANKLDPKDAETFCEIGMAFIRGGNSATAEKAFGAALREDPKSACGTIGGHLARLPQVGRGAAKELAELSKAEGKRPVWDRAFAEATRARVLLASGALRDGRKAGEEAVALAPAMGTAHLALGLAALKLKDDAKAAESLSRAIELEPGYGAARLALADLWARGESGDVQRAVDEYEAFVKIGGSEADVSRAKKAAAALRKRLAQR